MRATAAERHMRIVGPADIEYERIAERLFVAVGRPQHRYDALASRDRDAIHLDVDFGGAGPERDRRRPPQHLFDSTLPHGRVGAIPLDLRGIVDERLEPVGQRILRGVAAGERDHEEEDVEFGGGYRQPLAVLVGDDRGSQHAPDVIGGPAALLGGQFRCIGEDLAEQLEVSVGLALGSRRIRLQDKVEGVKDLGPVRFGDPDDVADHRHGKRVGDLVDPVAAAGLQQVVDHRGGTPADALLESPDRSRGEGVRHHPAPFEEIGRVHVDDRRKRPHGTHPLNQRPIRRGERFGVTVDAVRMAESGGHPEIALQRRGDPLGEVMAEDRPITTQFDEQGFRKTALPQRRIRQVDRSRGGHAVPFQASLTQNA